MDRNLRTLPEPTVTGSPREGRGRATAALISVCLGFFVIQLDVTIVNVALPAIQLQIGGSLAGLQWVVDAYTLALASIMLTAGSTADRVGARKIFTLGLAAFAIGSAACAAARRSASWSPPAPSRAWARRPCCPARWRCWCTSSPTRGRGLARSACGAGWARWASRSARWPAASW
jgi:MFS family permease